LFSSIHLPQTPSSVASSWLVRLAGPEKRRLRLTACARAGSLLARVYQILKTKVALEDELDKLKRGSVGPATTPSRPVTRSGAAAAVGPPVAAPTKPIEVADARKIK